MSQVIEARHLSRRFEQVQAVDNVDLSLSAGTVMGLIGPNGAGKTTLLRALLGLTDCEGEVSVLGMDPRREHARLMEQVCFIADTAVLPRWITVQQLLDYVSGVHPRFDRAQAEHFLASTDVTPKRKVRELSKGMTVQLHLALVMAIDAKVLILDEPTLGLDLLFRKRFYEQLLNDYFDDERTIIISTHQVEEVQHILTEVVFMDRGRLIMQQPMATYEDAFAELHVVGEAAARAEAIPHIGKRTILGGKAIIYEGVDRALLESLGEVRTPSVSDLFVAKIGGEQSHV
jgi:ABC-2 type transport system ATP-binding protein